MQWQGSRSDNARLTAALPGKDLALLQLEDGGGLIPASFYSGVVPDGVDVFAIGYPASVDVALEQSEADVLQPQVPVKARGSVSAGRSSKSVESILHTAPIAPGNSGGPVVDACGRVVGINSFGSVADGGGAEFYFAVSNRELSSFLANEGLDLRTVTGECRSVADLTRAEAEREAAARSKLEAEARIAAELQRSREGKVRRDAEHAVIGERENHMAFAALLLVLSAVAGGAAWQFTERGQRDRFKIAASVGAMMFIASLVIFAVRPSFDEIDERVRTAMTQNLRDEPVTPAKTMAANGKRRCVIQPERSRVTMSNTDDVLFDWSKSGCINGRTQYVESGEGWSRTFVPNNDAEVSLVSYAPASETYRIERYLLGMEAMEKAREARKRYDVTRCSNSPETIAKIDNMNKAVREILPATPNEILVFSCSGG
ncbi:MAG: trypsin-like peptidase domain-containing protein [Sphingomonadaceae bacterium]|nr:trypsin-like peptidase domain-containing protein [Sphingomonadaceae bacterium]